ncbi:MAG: hypothetical protein AB7U75_14655 [Hyphomicrobiaceae bacterium]
MTRAARERVEMDMARDAAQRSLATMARDRATAGHLDAAAKLQAFKAKTCNAN